MTFKGGDGGSHYSSEQIKFLQTHFSLSPVELSPWDGSFHVVHKIS